MSCPGCRRRNTSYLEFIPRKRRGGYRLLKHSQNHPPPLFCAAQAGGLDYRNRSGVNSLYVRTHSTGTVAQVSLWPRLRCITYRCSYTGPDLAYTRSNLVGLCSQCHSLVDDLNRRGGNTRMLFDKPAGLVN